MRKWLTFLMTLLVGSVSYVNAENTQVSFEAGYRNDDIRWQLGAPGSNAVFERRLKFKNLDIFQIGICAKSFVGHNLYLRGKANWGWIVDGRYKENASFNLSGIGPFNSLQVETTLDSENIVDGRWVWDFDVGIGYPFYFCECTASLSPLVGYAYDEQNIRIESAHNDVFGFDSQNNFGAVPGRCCDDKFINRWYGPFIGLDFNYRPCDCWNFFAAFEYHFARYRGRANTNSGADFFDQYRTRSRNADGYVYKIGTSYDFGNDWMMGLNFSYKDFRTEGRHRHHGTNKFLNLANGGNSTSSNNNSDSGSGQSVRGRHEWRSYAVNISLGREF